MTHRIIINDDTRTRDGLILATTIDMATQEWWWKMINKYDLPLAVVSKRMTWEEARSYFVVPSSIYRIPDVEDGMWNQYIMLNGSTKVELFCLVVKEDGRI